MPPAAGCLPQALPVYCQVVDALEAGPRCLGDLGMAKDSRRSL